MVGHLPAMGACLGKHVGDNALIDVVKSVCIDIGHNSHNHFIDPEHLFKVIITG